MSELQKEKDLNLDMSDLNINKDHETTEASNVNKFWSMALDECDMTLLTLPF